MYPIVVLVLSKTYDMQTQTYNYFHMSAEEEEIVLDTFQPFLFLRQGFHLIGRVVKENQLDDTEISFLCAIHIMTEGQLPHS